MRRILVCGSRNYTDAALIQKVLSEYSDCIVLQGMNGTRDKHGRAIRGADLLARDAAVDLGLPVEDFPADWKTHGNAAGPIRNRAMLDTRPELVIAFGEGRGTSDTVNEAKRRGIPVVRYS